MPGLPNVYTFYPKHKIDSTIPINSLTYNCLAILAANGSLSTVFPSQEEKSSPSPSVPSTETLTPTNIPTNGFLSSTNSSSASQSPSPSSSFGPQPSNCEPSSSSSPSPSSLSSSSSPQSSFPSPSPSQTTISTNPLGDFQNIPITIKQFIVDYITRERLEISCHYLCDLLSDGGCYSLDLWKLCFYNQFKEAEMVIILSTLTKNCYNLRRLTLGGHTWIYKSRVVNGPMRNFFKENTLFKLRSLQLQQTSSPEELITIFSACPNLVKLEICQPSLNDKQIVIVSKELVKPAYDKVRHSLRDLCLPSSVQKAGIIKMVALFPNLVYLNCCHYEDVLEAIESCLMTMGPDDHIESSLDMELRQAATILSNLHGLTVTHPIGRSAVTSLVTLSPNLRELVLEVDGHMVLYSIADLKYLARLALHNSQSSPASFLQQVLPLLQQIGDNLQALDLEGFDVVDLSTCARYCPNLRHFSGQWFTILSCTQATPGLTISKQERANLQRPFSHLQSLRLRPRTQRNLGVRAIVYILTHATNIESIELYSCPGLTDEQLIDLIKNNSLRNLRSLILRHGHFLSKSCLNRLVHSLDKLSFLDCGAPLLSKAELH